jgi:hypothetical protein
MKTVIHISRLPGHEAIGLPAEVQYLTPLKHAKSPDGS